MENSVDSDKMTEASRSGSTLFAEGKKYDQLKIGSAFKQGFDEIFYEHGLMLNCALNISSY